MSLTSNLQPIQVHEVELAGAIPPVSGVNPQTGARYQRALSLVRLHSRPLGTVEIALGDDGLAADALAAHIWGARVINDHLRRDGLPEITALTADGLPPTGTPTCLELRAALQAGAPRVSVVVATHNRTESLVTTLNSLLDQDYPNFEIIVVDNAPSSDATADTVRQIASQHPHVRYAREDRPGLAVAHNRGLQDVTGEFVAFTDDDVIADRHWLAEIVRGFHVTDNVACVTGLIFPGELETPAQLLSEQYGGFAKGFAIRIFDRDEHRLDNPLYPYAVGPVGSGANMAFRTSALLDMNGFDPSLGAGSLGVGGDDLAAFHQVITRGYRLVFQPAAIVRHWDRENTLHQNDLFGLKFDGLPHQMLVDKPWLTDIAISCPMGWFICWLSRIRTEETAGLSPGTQPMERKGCCAALSRTAGRWHARKTESDSMTQLVAGVAAQLVNCVKRRNEQPGLRIEDTTRFPSSIQRLGHQLGVFGLDGQRGFDE